MVGVLNYRREVRARREVIWKTLTDDKGWRDIPALANWFGRVEWYEGKPWRVGSRMLIEHFWPQQADVRLVLLSCTRLEEFSWIGHARSLTAHQQIRLQEFNQNQCLLTSSMSYTGRDDDPAADSNSGPGENAVVMRILHTFLDAVADESERQKHSIPKAG